MVCLRFPPNGFRQVTNQIRRTGVAIGVNIVKCLITKLGLQRHGKTKIRDFKSAPNRCRQSGGGLKGDVNGDGTYWFYAGYSAVDPSLPLLPSQLKGQFVTSLADWNDPYYITISNNGKKKAPQIHQWCPLLRRNRSVRTISASDSGGAPPS